MIRNESVNISSAVGPATVLTIDGTEPGLISRAKQTCHFIKRGTHLFLCTRPETARFHVGRLQKTEGGESLSYYSEQRFDCFKFQVY